MTLVNQKNHYKKEKKKKRVFTEVIIEEPDLEELVKKIYKRKLRELGKDNKKLAYREALYLAVYQDMGNKGILKNPHGWMKLDI